MSAVVIFNGLPRAGKDEVIKQTNIHVSKLEPTAIVKAVSSIDPFRLAVSALGLEPANKTPEMRALLSEFKASADKHFDYSTSSLHNSVTKLFNSFPDRGAYLFTQIREPHNIQKLKARIMYAGHPIKVLTVLVTGRGVAVNSNSSDMNVADYQYDVTLNNSGSLEDLDEGCFDLACMIIKPMRLKERTNADKATIAETDPQAPGDAVSKEGMAGNP